MEVRKSSEYLRGLNIGFGGFLLLLFGEFRYRNQTFLNLGVNPDFWAFLALIGLLGMFVGPLYYWVIDPFMERRRPSWEKSR